MVGEEEKEFYVYKAIVVQSSAFFRAAFDKGWKEATEKVIRLTDVELETFGIYLGWLYTGRLDLSDELSIEKLKETPNPSDEMLNELYQKHTAAYVFGDRIQDDQYCNVVSDGVRAILTLSMTLPKDRITSDLWGRLPHSRLARLFVDGWAVGNLIPSLREKAGQFPSSFIAEIAFVSSEETEMGLQERRPRNRPKCYYHVHRDGAELCK